MESQSDTNDIANQCKVESQPVKTESQPSKFVQPQEQKEMKDIESTTNTTSNENDPSETQEYADLLLKLRSSESGDITLNRESNLSNSTNSTMKSNTIQNLQDTDPFNLLCNAVLSPNKNPNPAIPRYSNSNLSNDTQINNRNNQMNYGEKSRSGTFNNYYAYPLIPPQSEGNESFQYSSINCDNIMNCNEVALSPEFFLYLLQHTDGDPIRNYLDKPHLRLASPNQGQITVTTALNPKELVAEGVHASLRQLQIIYYLKNRSHLQSQFQGQTQEYHVNKSMDGTTNSNRIVISRKRVEPSTNQEGNSTQSNVLYPSLMKKVETQDDVLRRD